MTGEDDGAARLRLARRRDAEGDRPGARALLEELLSRPEVRADIAVPAAEFYARLLIADGQAPHAQRWARYAGTLAGHTGGAADPRRIDCARTLAAALHAAGRPRAAERQYQAVLAALDQTRDEVRAAAVRAELAAVRAACRDQATGAAGLPRSDHRSVPGAADSDIVPDRAHTDHDREPADPERVPDATDTDGCADLPDAGAGHGGGHIGGAGGASPPAAADRRGGPATATGTATPRLPPPAPAAPPQEAVPVAWLPADDRFRRHVRRYAAAGLAVLAAGAAAAWHLTGGGARLTGGPHAAGPAAPAGSAAAPAGGAHGAAEVLPRAPVSAPGVLAPPTRVRLVDRADSVLLTWSYPRGAEGPVLVAGGRAGGPHAAFGSLPAGSSRYTVHGLRPAVRYCFTVAVVYSADAVAPADRVCTRRTPATGPAPTRPPVTLGQ